MKYKRVYFRINTPSYYKNSHGVGFENQQAGEKFQEVATEIFLNDGWTIKQTKYNSGCKTVTKDKQELYLHPQSFSGVILEDNIQYIENLISHNSLFKFERTDIYEEVFDLTDEEYIDLLKGKQSEIEFDLLKTCQTKRSNLYITNDWAVLDKVLNKYRIKRLSHYVGVYSSSNPDIKWMGEVFDKLVADGKIATAKCNSGTGYRTVDFDDKKILYNNSGEEMEVECSYKKVNSILKKLQNCNWITDIRVIDNIA